ncbi:MAG: hypothetical protein R3F58_06425 [Steroidobacteraceae bacterium]|nr:hypothetical protein [Steroidobacteraceae bacterium]
MRTPHPGDQVGQALVETLVAMPLLLAVLIGVLYVGRLHDIDARTVAASRYAAFAAGERVASEMLTADNGRVAARIVAPSDRALTADDRWDDARLAAQYDSLWVVPTNQRRLIRAARDVSVSVTEGRLAGARGAALDTALTVTRTASLLGRGRFDLANDGVLTARAAINVAPAHGLPAPLDSLGLQLRAEVALLTNAWAATSVEQTVARVEALHPASGVGAVFEYLQPIVWLASILEPALRQLCVGAVNPEIVAPDRLLQDATAGSGSWRSRCP